MKDWLLLDSQSSVDHFCNAAYVINICKAAYTLHLSTSGGNTSTDKEATVPGYETVWFDPNGLTNIYSLANMVK